jgi:hypothetical protein
MPVRAAAARSGIAAPVVFGASEPDHVRLVLGEGELAQEMREPVTSFRHHNAKAEMEQRRSAIDARLGPAQQQPPRSSPHRAADWSGDR